MSSTKDNTVAKAKLMSKQAAIVFMVSVNIHNWLSVQGTNKLAAVIKTVLKIDFYFFFNDHHHYDYHSSVKSSIKQTHSFTLCHMDIRTLGKTASPGLDANYYDISRI